MKKRFIIGVDPDTDKCGVAIWSTEKFDFIDIVSLPFWDLIWFLSNGVLIKDKKTAIHYNNFQENIFVRIEAGWLVEKSNFHEQSGALQREKMAKNVGMNHEVGLLIEQYCIRYAIPHELIEPQGMKLKSTAFRNITGWMSQTNQDNRDAAMLVFKYG